MSARKRRLASGLLCLVLCGCGGGGGGTAFIPTPPVPPPPAPPPQSVAIFANPTVGEFASVGTSAKVANLIEASAPLGPISTSDADQPHIRYTSAGTYEVEVPGGIWDELTFYGQGTQGTVLNNGNTSGGTLLAISGSSGKGYRYSEVASYRSADSQQIGAFAFGVLTPAGGVPVTGSATYSGTVRGQSDVIASDSFNGPNRAVVEGSVNLDFNFASGSLTGAMSIGLNDAAGNALGLGTYSFRNTVFGVGSTSYSGKFDTAAAGDNFFLGQFTGPHAEETIGAWALPFILNVGNSTIEADHHTHQAFGAWIAKKP